MQTRTTWVKKSRLVKKWTNKRKTSKTWTNRKQSGKTCTKKKKRLVKHDLQRDKINSYI